jgi:hypothetical protein
MDSNIKNFPGIYVSEHKTGLLIMDESRLNQLNQLKPIKTN